MTGARPLALLAVAALVASAVFFGGGAPPAQAAHTLATPTNLTATAGDGEVVLSWEAVANADGYQIEHGVQLSGTTATATTTATSHTFSGLTNGQFYVFRVQATDSGGDHTTSAYSGWVTAMPLAQTSTRLVSNLTKPSARGVHVATFGTGWGEDSVGQEFTTGASPVTLESIELDVFGTAARGYNARESALVRVELWSANANGTPNARLATLTVPDTLPVGRHAFTAPAGTELAANTKYHVVIYAGNVGFNVLATVDDDEDPGAAAGWSIANGWNLLSAGDPHNRGNENWRTTRSSRSLKMAVKGYPPLVSNLGQTAGPVTHHVQTSTFAQGFTTGSNLAGYTLSSIQVDVTNALNAAAAAKVRAELWSADANGIPGGFLESLTVPATLPVGSNAFTAPAGTVLLPETTYHILINTTASQRFRIRSTSSDGEDSGAAAGWSIADTLHKFPTNNPRNPGSNVWAEETDTDTLKIAVKGNPRATGSGKPIWSATLNAASLGSDQFGCEGSSTNACSSRLSNNLFTYIGSERSIRLLKHNNGVSETGWKIILQVSPIVRVDNDFSGAEFKAITLHVGHRTFAVADAPDSGVSHTTSVGGDTSINYSSVEWRVSDMTWAASDQIRVMLTIPDTSPNNDLSSLAATTSTSETGTYSTQTLTPAFAAGTTSYAATVPNSVTHARLTPTVDDTGKATVQVGKTVATLATVVDGSASGPIALDVGNNAIIVRVTAENGDTQDYTVTIRRQSANANLSALAASSRTTGAFSALTLSPTFDAGTTAYSVRVVPDVTFAKVTPTVADPGTPDEPNATVQVGKRGAALATVASGSDSAPIRLEVGANEIVVRVTAEDTSVTRDYTVTINVDGTPSAPAGLKVTPGPTALDLTWTAPGVTVNGYDVHYTTMSADDLADDAEPGYNQHPRLGRVVNRNPSRGWVALPKSGTAPKYGIGSLSPGQTYRVRVRAYNSYGIGPWAVGRGTPGEAPLTVSLSASAQRVREGDEVTITATVMHNGRPTVIQEDLEVLLSTHLGTAEAGDVGTAKRILIEKYTDSGSVTIPTHRDGDSDDERFAVLIRWIPSQSAARAGHPSIVWVTVTEGDPAPPKAVIHVPELRASGGDGALHLTWSETAATGNSGYDVEYKRSSAPNRDATTDGDPATGWVDAGHTGTERSMTISGLGNGVSYDARVRLAFRNGTGAWSEVVSAQTREPADRGGASEQESGPQNSPPEQEGGQQNSPPEREAAVLPSSVTLSLDAATVAESAGTVTVTVTLDVAAPDGGVGGILTAGADGTATENADFAMPASVFIPGGQTSATATVTVTDDDVDEADETVVISALFDVGTALLEDTITLTVTDDDTAAVTVTASNPLAVDEGATATYTVVLDSQPTADVTISATSSDTGAVSVSPASATFTSATWSTPVTFTITGTADTDTNDESAAISHRVTSDDANYATALAATVTVSVTDTTTPPPQLQAQERANQPPTVASAIADASLEAYATLDIPLSGVFSDADSDALTITAGSSNDAVAGVVVSADQSRLTLTGVAEGTATITVTAEDADANRVSDAFEVTVTAPQSTLTGIAARYDANGDGAIDGTEYQQVKNDWLTAKITQAEFLEVVRIYLKSN